jgi:hypothetical protein
VLNIEDNLFEIQNSASMDTVNHTNINRKLQLVYINSAGYWGLEISFCPVCYLLLRIFMDKDRGHSNI